MDANLSRGGRRFVLSINTATLVPRKMRYEWYERTSLDKMCQRAMLLAPLGLQRREIVNKCTHSIGYTNQPGLLGHRLACPKHGAGREV